MASYKILFDRDVEKDLKTIPRQQVKRVLHRILSLSSDSRPAQSAKLEGTSSTYRLRIGDYRAIYQLDDKSRTVTIYHVRHRKDVYRVMR